MKTKPFDLELALAGHPVIYPLNNYEVLSVTTEGRIIDDTGTYESRLCLKLRSFDGYIHDVSWPLSGRYGNLKLAMPDIDWQPNLKFGDLVDIRNSETENWSKEYVYLGQKGGLHLIVDRGDVRFFEKPDDKNIFECYFTKHVRLHKEEEKKIEVTVKINGKEIDPSQMPEETWLNLRKG